MTDEKKTDQAAQKDQASKGSGEKKTVKKSDDGRMTPEKAKKLGLDPFPYGGK